MLITNHWSATSPDGPLRDYHVEFGLRGGVTEAELLLFRQAVSLADLEAAGGFAKLRGLFDVWKNLPLGQPSDYGTWHINHDPTNQSADCEIGALCMGGEGVGLTRWGRWPYTRAHAWMHIGLNARVCKLKGIDSGATFEAGQYGFINGPIHRVSTHGERAYQTPSPDAHVHPDWGYFAYSGDPQLRWDIAAADYSEAGHLADPQHAVASALATAQWIREQTHATIAAGIDDFWGLDK